MKKGKVRTVTTIVLMTLVAIFVIWYYYDWSNRTETPNKGEELTEVEKLLQKDLENYYPETTREVVKLFSDMLKELYSGLSDEETEALALKIRELYDEEFISNNPEQTYLKNLYSELAVWKNEDRRITNFIIDDKETEQSSLDGKEYDVEYVYYTIQENVKFKEYWRILLRQDENNKWKVLGWELAPVNE